MLGSLRESGGEQHGQSAGLSRGCVVDHRRCSTHIHAHCAGSSPGPTAVSYFARGVVAAQGAVRKADDQSRLPRCRAQGIRHRGRGIRQPVLHGQGRGQIVPGRTEEALRRQWRKERPHHVRPRRRPGRSGSCRAHQMRGEPLQVGHRGRNISAAIRFASTHNPRAPSAPSWISRPMDCGASRNSAHSTA